MQYANPLLFENFIMDRYGFYGTARPAAFRTHQKRKTENNMTNIAMHAPLPRLTEADHHHRHNIHEVERFRLEPFKIKVITAFDAAKIWNLDPPPDGIPYYVRYRDETLLTCARENNKWMADWRLVWLYGLSLWELHRHSRETGGACFDHTFSWWHGHAERDWMKKKFEAGYYLVDVSGKIRKQTWEEQEESIRNLGKGITRAPDAIVAETALLTARHSEKSGGSGEVLLPDFLHRGTSMNSAGEGVCLGGFRPKIGMRIIPDLRHVRGSNAIGVCLVRQFDH